MTDEVPRRSVAPLRHLVGNAATACHRPVESELAGNNWLCGAAQSPSRLLAADAGLRGTGAERLGRRPRARGRTGEADALRARGRARGAVPRDARGRARAA